MASRVRLGQYQGIGVVYESSTSETSGPAIEM